MKIISHLLWLTPFVSFVGGYLIATLFFSHNQIPVPTIIGTTLEKALVILSAHDLNIRIIDYKEDPATPEGTIISQSPKAGTPLKKNQALYVTVTQKPKPLLMPDGAQRTAESIVKELQQTGIPFALYPVSAGAETACVAQWPDANAPLTQEGAYLYTSQLPPKPVVMPSFKGKSLEEALAFLSLYAIKPMIAQSSYSNAIHPEKCIIIDQRPAAGILVILDRQNPLSIQLQI